MATTNIEGSNDSMALLELEEQIENGEISFGAIADMLIHLAKEQASVKRELSELRTAMQAQAYDDNERIERILDDIVMLDERTQGVNIGGQKLLSKEVYIYDAE